MNTYHVMIKNGNNCFALVGCFIKIKIQERTEAIKLSLPHPYILSLNNKSQFTSVCSLPAMASNNENRLVRGITIRYQQALA